MTTSFRLMLCAAVIAGTIGCDSPQLIPEKDLVPPEQLQLTLLEVPGWTREPVQVQKLSGTMPMTIAETNYTKGPIRAHVKAYDSGEFARAYAKLTSNYEEHTGQTHSYSSTLKGIPSVETVDPVAKQASVALLVGNRLVVSVEGTGVEDIQSLRDVASGLNLERLDQLKSYRAKYAR
jgi:hypothetical protein